MAGGKKSFVLYADLQHTIKHLTDEQAGDLFKHILSYVNDENPISNNPITTISFEPIKQQLKRDLEKWGTTKEVRSKAGKASAEARRIKKEQSSTNPTSVKSVQQSSTNPTVSVNDNVNVNEIKEKQNAIALSLIENVNSDKKEVFNNWVQYRKEIKKPIKSQTTLCSLIKKINLEPLAKCELVISASIENQWVGLFWDKETKKRDNTIEVAKENAAAAIELIRNDPSYK